jgi:hypothetical protein
LRRIASAYHSKATVGVIAEYDSQKKEIETTMNHFQISKKATGYTTDESGTAFQPLSSRHAVNVTGHDALSLKLKANT